MFAIFRCVSRGVCPPKPSLSSNFGLADISPASVSRYGGTNLILGVRRLPKTPFLGDSSKLLGMDQIHPFGRSRQHCDVWYVLAADVPKTSHRESLRFCYAYFSCLRVSIYRFVHVRDTWTEVRLSQYLQNLLYVSNRNSVVQNARRVSEGKTFVLDTRTSRFQKVQYIAAAAFVSLSTLNAHVRVPRA